MKPVLRATFTNPIHDPANQLGGSITTVMNPKLEPKLQADESFVYVKNKDGSTQMVPMSNVRSVVLPAAEQAKAKAAS